MERKLTLLCSTGTMVSRYNGFDYRRAIRHVSSFVSEGLCDGAELMMLPFYYDKTDEVIRAFRETGVNVPVTHIEKQVGTLLSDAAAAAEDDAGLAADIRAEAEELFRLNCDTAARAGSKAAVLHLWGGLNSDSHVEYNTDALGGLIVTAEEFGLKLLVENVPCTTYDPLTNWRALGRHLSRCGLVFDTRFATFHRQAKETLSDPGIAARIRHVHIGDVRGEAPDFSAIHPIYQPGDGTADFPMIAKMLRKIGYGGSVTLESPAMNGSGIVTAALKKSLAYIGGLICS